MAQFNFKKYMSAPSKVGAEWDADKNGFTIVVGTTKTTFKHKMDKAGMTILQYAKFHIRNDQSSPMLTLVSFEGNENYKMEWLSDAQLLKLDLLTMQMDKFFSEYPFNGEGFTKFARTILRPMNDGLCKHNMSWAKKNRCI